MSGELTSENPRANEIHPPAMPVRGRILALAGIVLVALNLRLAISSLSVLFDPIGKSVSGFNVTVIAVVPLICFSLFGLLAHDIAERIGFEKSLVVAMLAVCAGTVLRAFMSNMWTFTACTVIAGAGMAVGNVLLPPVVKKYFPDHVGGMTATYAVTLAVSSALPTAFAIPIADAFNWRVSIGWWGIVALVAALPWVVTRPDRDLQEFDRARKERVLGTGPSHPQAMTRFEVWRWPISWALMSLLGFGFLSMYAITTNLKFYLAPASGRQYFTAAEVGTMLTVYTGLGVVHSLVIPLVIGRMRHPYLIIALSGLLQFVGYLGLLYEPKLSWVWVVVLAPSLMVTTASFQLINLRTRTAPGASALSSFVQGVGYIFACVGPLFVSLLHARSGGWAAPFWFLILAAAVMMLVAAPSVRHEYLEDAIAVHVRHRSDQSTTRTRRMTAP